MTRPTRAARTLEFLESAEDLCFESQALTGDILTTWSEIDRELEDWNGCMADLDRIEADLQIAGGALCSLSSSTSSPS